MLFSALTLVTILAANEPLVGPNLGNRDVLMADAARLYSKKQYPKAAANLLKATRIDPEPPNTYLQLARSLMAAKQTQRACYAYRVYLKVAPESAERSKPSAEADQCDRQLKAQKKENLSAKFVEARATFYEALDKREFLGESGAAGLFVALVNDGFLSPELAEMSKKLAAATTEAAKRDFDAVVRYEKISAENMKSTLALLTAAHQAGSLSATAQMEFLSGVLLMNEKEYSKAETAFSRALAQDPSNVEYAVRRASALFMRGDATQAFDLLEKNASTDIRASVARASRAVSVKNPEAARKIEDALFLQTQTQPAGAPR